MAPFSYMMNLFNAPPLEELTVGKKMGRIAQIVAVLVSISIMAAAAGIMAIELAER